MLFAIPLSLAPVKFFIYYLTTVWQINVLWVSAEQMRAEAVTSTCKDDVLAPCRFNFTKPYFSHSFHNCCNKSYQRSTLLAKQIGSEVASFFTCMTLSTEKLTFYTF